MVQPAQCPCNTSVLSSLHPRICHAAQGPVTEQLSSWWCSSTKLLQLPEVLEAFAIAPSPRDLLSRCVKCNGNFLPR